MQVLALVLLFLSLKSFKEGREVYMQTRTLQGSFCLGAVYCSLKLLSCSQHQDCYRSNVISSHTGNNGMDKRNVTKEGSNYYDNSTKILFIKQY